MKRFSRGEGRGGDAKGRGLEGQGGQRDGGRCGRVGSGVGEALDVKSANKICPPSPSTNLIRNLSLTCRSWPSKGMTFNTKNKGF